MPVINLYEAVCTHPICPGRDDCVHCTPHPYDEEECDNVCCGMLEEPSYCEVVNTKTWKE
jgi:hypothetical protein